MVGAGKFSNLSKRFALCGLHMFAGLRLLIQRVSASENAFQNGMKIRNTRTWHYCYFCATSNENNLQPLENQIHLDAN